MEHISDLLGMELDGAKALLETEGLAFRIVETKPTKKNDDKGTFRVIRVSLDNNQEMKLVVCKI